MTRIPIKDFHPGAYLLEELQARNISQVTFAKVIGKNPVEVNSLINGKRNITPERAVLISAALGTQPYVWTNLQQSYDLKKTEKKISTNKIGAIKQRALKYFAVTPQYA
ncbi:MAG: HigA family addiction module antitoxin [Candidatus Absconditabacterales bacterium]|jgi:addiction module HigA family antidote